MSTNEDLEDKYEKLINNLVQEHEETLEDVHAKYKAEIGELREDAYLLERELEEKEDAFMTEEAFEEFKTDLYSDMDHVSAALRNLYYDLHLEAGYSLEDVKKDLDELFSEVPFLEKPYAGLGKE